MMEATMPWYLETEMQNRSYNMLAQHPHTAVLIARREDEILARHYHQPPVAFRPTMMCLARDEISLVGCIGSQQDSRLEQGMVACALNCHRCLQLTIYSTCICTALQQPTQLEH
jgi:hypothetical protein